MKTYQVYYLVSTRGIEAGPFATVDDAVNGKKQFRPPFAALLTVVKSSMDTEEV